MKKLVSFVILLVATSAFAGKKKHDGVTADCEAVEIQNHVYGMIYYSENNTRTWSRDGNTTGSVTITLYDNVDACNVAADKINAAGR